MSAEFWRWVASTFLGRRYVKLFDRHDREETISPVFFNGGRACAARHGFGIATVTLHDGGATTGCSYVERWEPYAPSGPFDARYWPAPPSSTTQTEEK